MRDHLLDQDQPSQILPLKTQNLIFEAKGNRIIDGINLNLEAGSLSVIMGPNGAGKSVLLRLLHGLIEPTSGAINYAAIPMSEGVRKRQALVFQRPVLLRRSVAENINFVLRLRGAADFARRDELLQTVGLLDHAKQPARLLSVGEQQRLALARALATDPEILFLDEPTASLDPASTEMIEQIVRDAHSGGTKIIFVTHDIAQARRLADNIVFLHRGRLMEVTAASSFFANPASPSAQAYLEGRIIF